MVDRTVTHHLEILRLVRRWRFGVVRVEGVRHADALDRALLDAVDHRRLLDVRRLQDRRHDVDDVMELVTDAALVLDHGGPRNRGALADAAEVRRDLLGPQEGRVEGPAPCHRHVVVRLVRAPDVVEILELIGDRNLHAVEHRDLVRRADQRTFGAAAVVAADVDDQRVVELAHILDRLDHAANLVVGVHKICRIHIDLTEEHLLFVGGKRIPLLEQVVRPRRHPGVRRDDAQFLLVLEDLVAQRIPALVEEMQIGRLLDPFQRRMVRRVRAARHVIDEEGLLRRKGVDAIHVSDRLVGHRGREVVARVALERIDVRRVPRQVVRLPLIGVAAHEAVEVLEAHPDRPLVEGTVGARLKRRRVVVLAEPRRAIAIVFEDLADRRLVTREEAVIAGVTCRLLGDDTKARRVMVAPGDQRGARRRAQRRRMEVGVAKAVVGDAVERRRGDDAAEGARCAESDVVGRDQQDVGGTFRRHNARRPVRLGLERVGLDLAAELRRRRRNLVARDRHGRAGCTRRTVDLLSCRRCCGENCGENERRANDIRTPTHTWSPENTNTACGGPELSMLGAESVNCFRVETVRICDADIAARTLELQIHSQNPCVC